MGVGLLVLLIGAFLGYARYRVRHLVTDLPQKLGIDVTEGDGRVYLLAVERVEDAVYDPCGEGDSA